MAELGELFKSFIPELKYDDKATIMTNWFQMARVNRPFAIVRFAYSNTVVELLLGSFVPRLQHIYGCIIEIYTNLPSYTGSVWCRRRVGIERPV